MSGKCREVWTREAIKEGSRSAGLGKGSTKSFIMFRSIILS
jgi:hypothetical protein